MGIADQIIQAESGGNPNAQNPNSSAGGSGQFIDSTFLNTLKKYRPDLVQQFSPSELLAMKRDPELSRAMTEAYASDNAAFLRERGHEATPGNVYLAHFAGPQGAAALLGAQPDASVASIMGPAAVKANPFLAKMTVADLQKWAGGKMGGGAAPTSASSPAFSQFAAAPGAGPTGAVASAAGPATPEQQQAATADPLAAIPAMVAQLPQKFLPSMQLIPPEPPGMARARALARAMATRPLAAKDSTV